MPLRQLQAKNQYLGVSPRYGLEAIGIAAMAFLAGFLVLQRGGGDSVFPLLGALALGAQRLLPAMQQVYGSWATLTGYNSGMASVLEMLDQALPQKYISREPCSFSIRAI